MKALLENDQLIQPLEQTASCKAINASRSYNRRNLERTCRGCVLLLNARVGKILKRMELWNGGSNVTTMSAFLVEYWNFRLEDILIIPSNLDPCQRS
jgi:hypothetical protein